MASSCSSRTRRRPECEFSSSRLQRGEGRSCVAQVSAACGPLPLPAAGRGRDAQSCACRVRGSLRECVALTRARSVARRLRRTSTRAELLLWSKLRVRQLGSFKFVRQEPIGGYVVDFICRDRRVIVEVDGGQHATDPRDLVRDRWLRDHNYRVLRFWNNDVLTKMEGVLEPILSALRADTPPHPDRFALRPLPASGER